MQKCHGVSSFFQPGVPGQRAALALVGATELRPERLSLELHMHFLLLTQTREMLLENEVH